MVITLTAIAGNAGYADEEEKRRVDISLSIFPRVVAVDNSFRKKLVHGKNVQLIFIYSKNEPRAVELAEKVNEKSRSIGGMKVVASAENISSVINVQRETRPTAIFLAERLADDELLRVMNYGVSESRLVFSPFSGDVERGATVGISVTNRVKPYFNLKTLRRSEIEINALLMKMSKRYE